MINHIKISKNIPKVLFFLLFIFSSYEIKNFSSPDVEKLLDKKIKNLSGGKGKIIKYTKIN